MASLQERYSEYRRYAYYSSLARSLSLLPEVSGSGYRAFGTCRIITDILFHMNMAVRVFYLVCHIFIPACIRWRNTIGDFITIDIEAGNSYCFIAVYSFHAFWWLCTVFAVYSFSLMCIGLIGMYISECSSVVF